MAIAVKPQGVWARTSWGGWRRDDGILRRSVANWLRIHYRNGHTEDIGFSRRTMAWEVAEGAHLDAEVDHVVVNVCGDAVVMRRRNHA